MTEFKHILAIDLSSYGAAFAIINQFVDDDAVKVFEVSPCGQAATLILIAKESVSLQVIKSEMFSYFKNQILYATLVENINNELLPTYLSQNKTLVQKSMGIVECSWVSEALSIANKALEQGLGLVDFRVIRTNSKNVIITITSDSVDLILGFQSKGLKTTLIENVQPTLKSYFEI